MVRGVYVYSGELLTYLVVPCGEGQRSHCLSPLSIIIWVSMTLWVRLSLLLQRGPVLIGSFRTKLN